ncbi:MAG: hypothetical protein LBT43_03870 [Prevotella sp.]|jgi:hypothetical protein|nr:hypothetical protein [Prevotella sp.]
MEKYLKHFTAIILSVLFAACTNDNDKFSNYSDSNEQEITSDIILQERDSKLPDVITREIVLEPKTKTKASGQNGEIIGNSDILLGYSYTIGNSIMGDYDNVISPVVDIRKVKLLDPEYITPKQLLVNFTGSYAYSNFNRYEHNSTVTKKVTSGFNINIKLFSFGRKKTTTEVFKTLASDSTKIVYGELNLDIRNSSFSLQSAEGARKIYARQCLSNTFMKNLYTTPIGNMLDYYGDYVLTGYYTGGKAMGLYSGLAKGSFLFESKEKDMNTDINASFSWNSNSASGNLNFGKNNSSSTTTAYKTEKTQIYVKTYGGVPSGQAMVAAVPLESLQLDLSSWLNSLNNHNTHTIVDVLDQGLCPISYFVLEENYKKRFDDSYYGVLEKRSRLITPYIEIVRVYVRTSASGEPLYEVAAVLNTRQGDKIILSDGKASATSDAVLMANANNTTFLQKANTVFAEKKIYYDLQFRTNTTTKLNPALRTPLSIRLDGFNESSMYRYKNPNTGIEYIYDTTRRIAYSHLTDKIDEDWILDDYGIRDWVESLPVRSISMATLANSYRIIGL